MNWCIFCGEMVKAQHMSMHLWKHGYCETLIGGCAVNCPSPWSKHQGYWWQNPHTMERLIRLGC